MLKLFFAREEKLRKEGEAKRLSRRERTQQTRKAYISLFETAFEKLLSN